MVLDSSDSVMDMSAGEFRAMSGQGEPPGAGTADARSSRTGGSSDGAMSAESEVLVCVCVQVGYDLPDIHLRPPLLSFFSFSSFFFHCLLHLRQRNRRKQKTMKIKQVEKRDRNRITETVGK